MALPACQGAGSARGDGARPGGVEGATAAPGCPTVAEDYAGGSGNGDGQERFWVTRDELVGLVEQAMRERADVLGLAGTPAPT